MGFIKAAVDSLGGTFADQWLDFYGPKQNVSPTAALIPAVPQGTNAGRGENYKGSENIISNGSKIMVPDNMGLITIQDGQITGCIVEPGPYIFNSNDPNSRSFFGGNGILSSTISQSWERFKYGGQPGTQQLAFYVNLKEIPNNKFGTQTEIAFFDNFLGTQVSVVTRGTYTLQITDPLLFVKNFVPINYLQPNAPIFDFTDMDNDSVGQLFGEVVGCLGGALSKYTNDPEIQGSLIKIQSDQVGFAKSLSSEVEANYQWKTARGFEIVRVAILGIEYDEDTKELLKEVRKDDRELRKATRMGQAYGANMAGMMAAASGQAMQAAASNENGAMMGFAGLNMAQGTGSTMMGTVANMQQPSTNIQTVQPDQNNATDPYAELTKMKQLLDAGVISQADFDAKKAQILGI